MNFIVFLSFLFLNFDSNSCQGHQGRQRIVFKQETNKPIIHEPTCQTYNNKPGICRILLDCSTFFQDIARLSRSPCQITRDQDGVCCPHAKAPTNDPSETLKNIVNVDQIPIVFPPVTSEELNFACQQGLNNQSVRIKFQEQLAQNHVEVDRDSPAFFHARLFETAPDIIQLSQDANVVLEASKELAKSFGLNKDQKTIGLKKINFKETIIRDKCPKPPPCKGINHRYRTMDGSCNNLRNPRWGMRGVSLKRMLPAHYHDELSVPRQSVSGLPLPSSRQVSRSISDPLSDIYVNFTILIWQWGQFLDHDITHAPISKGARGKDISCCTKGQFRTPAHLDPECMPIEIPSNDDFYGQFGQKCMEFVRSMPAVKNECSLGHREQINQITSYIDGSNVYGSTDAEARRLRDPTGGGRLKVQSRRRGGDLLPVNNNDIGCIKSASGKDCFLAGDSRVNEQVNLAMMHTIWVREHNRIVKELAVMNPHWDDETLYQEGRRIVSAQLQHITYNEYLPIVLGREFMEKWGLHPKRSGYYTGYNDRADATIVNGFATAGFRYGHSLVTGHLQSFNSFGQLKTDNKLSSVAFKPFDLYDPRSFDDILRGLLNQHSQKNDRKFSEELTNKLFGQGNPGMDLVALNLQRGRDHGLPPYVEWRKVCNLPPLRSWQDMYNEDKNIVNIDRATIDAFRGVYDRVEDMDLFIVGVAEKEVPGALVGPTFLCILGHQFITLKIGDRFYYENGPQEGSRPTSSPLSPFTPSQLDEIKKTSLARIICDNADSPDQMRVQPLVFITAHSVNKRALCNPDKLIRKVNLEPWRDSGAGK